MITSPPKFTSLALFSALHVLACSGKTMTVGDVNTHTAGAGGDESTDAAAGATAFGVAGSNPTAFGVAGSTPGSSMAGSSSYVELGGALHNVHLTKQ